MRLAARTFICLFVPLVALLSGAFQAVEKAVVSTVHTRLRSVRREHESSIARMQAHNERQNKRNLRIVAENAALKAGLQLLLDAPNDRDTSLTVEEQLREDLRRHWDRTVVRLRCR